MASTPTATASTTAETVHRFATHDTVPVRRVIEVYKNHLDVGFTEMAAKATHDAIRWMMGVAAETGRILRAEGGPRQFVWTVPSYLAYEALEILSGEALANIERALAEGDIAWHALPFTTHTELMDESLCQFACELSRTLDRRFGVVTKTAKLTDVPGHTRGLVTVLARCGIDFLHIGVNGMSPVPDVPPIFRWRDNLANEVVVAYEPGYANCVRIPGDDQVLQWRFVGDNMEVPSIADIRANRAAARAAYPHAEVVAGRMDDWAQDIVGRATSLPVVTSEIGDSWIHGTGSDPWKTIRFRALLRLRSRWLKEGRLNPTGAEHFSFSKNLLLIAEHTWGLSFTAHTHHNTVDWDNDRFGRVRHRGCWKAVEASWQEQRDYLELGLEALSPDLRLEAQRALAALTAPSMATTPGTRNVSGAMETHAPLGSVGTDVDPGAEIQAGPWRLRLDRQHGGIVSLVAGDGGERVAANGHLARLRYQTFDADDCRRFVREYCPVTGDWLVAEFAKAGLENSRAVSRYWDPQVRSVRRHDDASAVRLEVTLTFPEAAIVDAGAPRCVQVSLIFPHDGSSLRSQVSWSGKHPTRLPEALWWSFQPHVEDPTGWRFDKLGHLVDPQDVVARGGRTLHAIGRGAVNHHSHKKVTLLSPDAHLLAPGEPQLYRFTDQMPDLAGGLHLNLVNNLWGTNFPMWCGDDITVRANLMWSDTPIDGRAYPFDE